MFFQEISYHLAANPARFSLEQRPLNQQQLDLYKMLLHGRKMEARNFPRGSFQIKFSRLWGQSCSRHLMERHSPHVQPSSEKSLCCLPGWLKSCSTHLSWESMSKFTFLFHTQRFFFFTYSKVPDSSLLQRGRGTSSGKACRQRGPVGYCNHTKFHTLFTIFDLQGAYPTSYLLATFNLFCPGLNLLGKCFLCLSTF